MAQSLDSNIAYMFVGSLILFSFFFIHTWSAEVIQYCPVDGESGCMPISYGVVSWFSDIGTTDYALAEALTITSQLYSEITNLEVFELIKPLGITKISRNDFITRFYNF